MRPRAPVVHFRGRSGSVVIAKFHERVNFCIVTTVSFGDILDIHALSFFFTDLEIVVSRLKQVLDALIVDFTH